MVSHVYQDDWLTIYGGDCRTVLAELPDESVHCVVTSPPYWGLRDYGHGDQLGLEPTPEQYVENMVAVFREVRRVLRSDGTVWLNLGDSYNSTPSGQNFTGQYANDDGRHGRRDGSQKASVGSYKPDDARTWPRSQAGRVATLKPKDLVGIPWRVAFALQADGWYLRSDIIWSKPNPMPESVTDRPTKSHEYVFLLAKSPRYYFDADAVREPMQPSSVERAEYSFREYNWRDHDGRANEATARKALGLRGTDAADSMARRMEGGRNIRTVWTVATQPYPGAHFAVFPEKLIEPCILAGTSERGVCPECGKPCRRVTETTTEFTSGSGRAGRPPIGKNGSDYEQATNGEYDVRMGPSKSVRTLSWIPSCTHDAVPVGAVVLDPFGGSGTTARVANRLSRRAVLIDLNPDYLKQQMDRNRDIPLGLGA